MTQIFNTALNIPEKFKKGILIIGNFDGLHKGHKFLIDYAKKLAACHSKAVIVWLYIPQPRLYLDRNTPKILMTDTQRIQALEDCHVDAIVAHRYNKENIQTLYEYFETKIIKQLEPWHIVVGSNTKIDTKFLTTQSHKHLFTLSIIDLHPTKKNYFSSTKIRNFIQQGKITDANNMLLNPWNILVNNVNIISNYSGTIIDIDKNYVLPPNNSHHKAYVVVEDTKIPVEIYVNNDTLLIKASTAFPQKSQFTIIFK